MLNEKLFTEKTVARILGRSTRKLQKDRQYQQGIPFIKLGRLVRYKNTDVLAYVKARTVKIS